MKKWFALVLAVIMVCSMTACGKKDDNKQTDPTDGSSATTGSNQNSANNGATENTLPDDWGVSGTVTVQGKDMSVQRMIFKWPTTKGNPAATGEAGPQEDGTFVLVDAYTSGTSPENVELTSFFPAYSQQTIDAFARFYGSRYKNGALTATKGDVSTINGYEVCKYTGTHTFEYKGKTYDQQFVAYVTTAKGNDGYVYFLVADDSDEQSLGAKIEENAYNMMLSLSEE